MAKRTPAMCRTCGKPRKGHPLARCEAPSAKTRGGGKRSKPARRVSRVVAELPTNAAKQTARTLLGQLETLQTELASRIQVVRELAEVL